MSASISHLLVDASLRKAITGSPMTSEKRKRSEFSPLSPLSNGFEVVGGSPNLKVDFDPCRPVAIVEQL